MGFSSRYKEAPPFFEGDIPGEFLVADRAKQFFLAVADALQQGNSISSLIPERQSLQDVIGETFAVERYSPILLDLQRNYDIYGYDVRALRKNLRRRYAGGDLYACEKVTKSGGLFSDEITDRVYIRNDVKEKFGAHEVELYRITNATAKTLGVKDFDIGIVLLPKGYVAIRGTVYSQTNEQPDNCIADTLGQHALFDCTGTYLGNFHVWKLLASQRRSEFSTDDPIDPLGDFFRSL